MTHVHSQQPPRQDLQNVIEQAFNSALGPNNVIVVISKVEDSLSAPVTIRQGAQPQVSASRLVHHRLHSLLRALPRPWVGLR